MKIFFLQCKELHLYKQITESNNKTENFTLLMLYSCQSRKTVHELSIHQLRDLNANWQIDLIKWTSQTNSTEHKLSLIKDHLITFCSVHRARSIKKGLKGCRNEQCLTWTVSKKWFKNPFYENKWLLLGLRHKPASYVNVTDKYLPMRGKQDATLDINMSVNIHIESLTLKQISLKYVTQPIPNLQNRYH